jgi:hypothetical protein
MDSPRPANEAGRRGSGSAGCLDHRPHSAPHLPMRSDLHEVLEADAKAFRCREAGSPEAEHYGVLFALYLLTQTAAAGAVGP